MTSGDPCTVTVARSLISGNNALSQYNAGGGGIAALGTAYVYLRSSTVEGNYAVVDAGGVLSSSNYAQFTNSTIVGNSSGAYDPGNGIYATKTTAFLGPSSQAISIEAAVSISRAASMSTTA